MRREAAFGAGVATFAAVLAYSARYLPPQEEWPRLGIRLPYGDVFLLGLTVALASLFLMPGLYYRRVYVEEMRALNDLPVFLGLLSSHIKSGRVVVSSIEASLAQVRSRLLRRSLKAFVDMVNEGAEVFEAFRESMKAVPARVRASLLVLVQAVEGGGRIADVIDEAAGYAEQLVEFERMKTTSLRPYVYIVLMALIVFYAAALFLVYLAARFAGVGRMEIMAATPEQIHAALFYLSMILSVFAGAVDGKILYGSFKYGLWLSGLFVLLSGMVLNYGFKVLEALVG